MNIIHVSLWPYVFTSFRTPLLRRQKKLFDKVVLYSLYEKKHVEKLHSEGFEVNSLKIDSSFGKYSIKVLMKFFWRLLKHLKNHKYDIIVGHQPMGGLIGILAGSLAKVPTKIYSTGGLKYFPEYKTLPNIIYKYGEYFLMKRTDAVLTVNREDYILLKKVNRLADKAYYVGPKGGCGINTKTFNPHTRKNYRDKARKELNMSDETLIIGYTGRIVWEKGFREMIGAAKTLKKTGLKYIFLILGEGPELNKIKKKINDEALENHFRFLGYKFNLDYYISAFDLFILPSYREGLPVSLLESMAMGIPCIATDIRGNRELIEDNKTGRLIPVKSTKALTEAIHYLNDNKNIANELGSNAAKEVALKYSEELMVEKTIKIYRRIAQSQIGF